MGKRIQTKLQRKIQVNSRLSNENQKLRTFVKVQGVEIKSLREDNEALRLQIEELQRIIFGRGKKDRKDQRKDGVVSQIEEAAKQIRPPESYRRAIPPAEEITETKHETLDHCPDCNSCLSDIKEVERYIEDILPIEQWSEVLKKTSNNLWPLPPSF